MFFAHQARSQFVDGVSVCATILKCYKYSTQWDTFNWFQVLDLFGGVKTMRWKRAVVTISWWYQVVSELSWSPGVRNSDTTVNVFIGHSRQRFDLTVIRPGAGIWQTTSWYFSVTAAADPWGSFIARRRTTLCRAEADSGLLRHLLLKGVGGYCFLIPGNLSIISSIYACLDSKNVE